MTKAKSSMKDRPQFAERVKAMRLRLGMEQVPFAQFLGVTQSRISEWESGKVEPSPEMYLRLANHGSPEDALWFWEHAGIDRDALRVAAGELLAGSYSYVTGDVVRLLRMKLVHHKLAESGRPILLSKELIPSPASTIGIERERGGAVLLVDTSVTDLASLLGKSIAIDSSLPRPWDSQRRPAGLVAGPLDLIEEEQAQAIVWFATLSAHSPEEKRIAAWEYRKPKELHWPKEIASPSTRFVRPAAFAKWQKARDLGLYVKVREQSMRQAPSNLKLFQGYRILGQWIGWLSR